MKGGKDESVSGYFELERVRYASYFSSVRDPLFEERRSRSLCGRQWLYGCFCGNASGVNFLVSGSLCWIKNHGSADGYNLALQQVEAEYVVLLNSDVEVTEHWLEPMISYLDGHPEVAACQPKIRSQRQKEYFEYAGAAGGFIDKYGYPFCRGRIMGVVEKDEGQYDTILPVFWATGAALFIRHADYREAGGLDGRFFAHMEEIDLCWRLRSRGREIVCIPQSTVYHVGGATLKKENPRKTFLNFRNNLVMLYKNLSDEELNKVMRIRTCLDYVAAFTFLLKGQLDNARAVMRARKEYKQICPSFSSSRKENLRKTSLNQSLNG